MHPTEILATADAPAAWDNPMGTDGFEFIEYAAPDPTAMVSSRWRATATRMSPSTARARSTS